MSVRLVVHRLVRVLAGAYFVVAVSAASVNGYEAYKRDVPNSFDQFARAPDPDKPWEAYWKPYVVVIDGKKVGFLEPDEKALDADVKKWAAEHPRSKPYQSAGKAVLLSLAIATALFAALWVGYRTVRWIALGFLDKPAA